MKEAAEEGRGKDDLQKQLVSADFHFCLSVLFVFLSGHLSLSQRFASLGKSSLICELNISHSGVPEGKSNLIKLNEIASS